VIAAILPPFSFLLSLLIPIEKKRKRKEEGKQEIRRAAG